MKNEFVPYKEALELKNLEFDEPCIQYYNHYGTSKPNPKWDGKLRSNKGKWENFIDYDDCVGTPLYQQAFRWFREKHRIISVIDFYNNGEEWENTIYTLRISEYKYFSTHDSFVHDYKSYEEAELACLKKLIEIVKQSK